MQDAAPLDSAEAPAARPSWAWLAAGLVLAAVAFRTLLSFQPERALPEEIEEWRIQRDPITLLKQWLREESLADDATLTAIDQQAAAAIQDSVAYAEAGTTPPENAGVEYMFAGTYS